ncbi:hypothetical protein BKA80DRAFT_29849 [Phyllosticta citrichinensis]
MLSRSPVARRPSPVARRPWPRADTTSGTSLSLWPRISQPSLRRTRTRLRSCTIHRAVRYTGTTVSAAIPSAAHDGRGYLPTYLTYLAPPLARSSIVVSQGHPCPRAQLKHPPPPLRSFVCVRRVLCSTMQGRRGAPAGSLLARLVAMAQKTDLIHNFHDYSLSFGMMHPISGHAPQRRGAAARPRMSRDPESRMLGAGQAKHGAWRRRRRCWWCGGQTSLKPSTQL